MMKFVSLGAGVQSTAMCLMALHGEFDMPDHCIFADTGWEPQRVYNHLDWLTGILEAAGLPVHIVSSGKNIREQTLKSKDGKTRWAALPFFTEGIGGTKEGKLRRMCTKEYKVEPIEKKMREILGVKPRCRMKPGTLVEQWRGISLDEVIRMKESDKDWIVIRYPLIDKRMSRLDCLTWMKRNGYPEPPRSSCVACPFHSDPHWQQMKDNYPAEFQDAVDFDKQIRTGLRGVKAVGSYLHRSLKPLDEVEFTNKNQPELFGEECEGYCGV